MSKSSSSSKGGFKGNTNQKPRVKKEKKGQLPAHFSWCFTWNNYPENAINDLKNCFNFHQILYIFGKEIGGENGVPHLQGFICNPKKKFRWSALKLCDKIHWENAKGSTEDNIKYCSKDGDYYCSDEFRPLDIITNLYPWQKDLLEIYKSTPNNRDIYWIYDGDGKRGKSSFMSYLAYHYNIIFLNAGDNKNIANIVYNKDMRLCKCLFLDIPRTKGNKCPYAVLECVKNGIITNTKFETGAKVFNAPHIFITSNFPPDLSELSLDRWQIYEINEKKEMVKKEIVKKKKKHELD